MSRRLRKKRFPWLFTKGIAGLSTTFVLRDDQPPATMGVLAGENGERIGSFADALKAQIETYVGDFHRMMDWHFLGRGHVCGARNARRPRGRGPCLCSWCGAERARPHMTPDEAVNDQRRVALRLPTRNGAS